MLICYDSDRLIRCRGEWVNGANPPSVASLRPRMFGAERWSGRMQIMDWLVADIAGVTKENHNKL